MNEHKSIVGVRPELVRVYGPTAGILLSQLLYWAGKSTDGWVKRTYKQLEEETGLKRLAIIRTLQRLERLGVIKKVRQKKEITIRVNVEYQNDTNNGIKMIPNEYQNDTDYRYQNDTDKRVQVIENQRLASPKINNKEINKILDLDNNNNTREPGFFSKIETVKETVREHELANSEPVRTVNPGYTPAREEAPARDEIQIERRKAVFRELEQMGFRIDEELLNEPDPEVFSTKLYAIDTNAPSFFNTMLKFLDEIGERNRLVEILRKYRERHNPRYIPQRWDINANLKFWDDLEYYFHIHTWQKKIAQELGIEYIDFESFTQLTQITAFCIREVPPSKASLVRMIIRGWYIYTHPSDVSEKAVNGAIENALNKIKAKATARQY